MKRPLVFRGDSDLYHADTCEPVRRAAKHGEVRLHALGRGAYPGKPLPSHVLSEVRTVGFWDAPHNQSWGLDWHRNEGIELTYVARGKVAFSVDDSAFTLDPGNLTITRPWQRHRLGAPNITACQLHWLILDVGVRRPNQAWRWPSWLLCAEPELRRLTNRLRHNERPVWRANAEIAGCFEKIAEAIRSNHPSRLTRLTIYINELIVALAEMLEQRKLRLDPSLSSTQRAVELFLNELPQRIGELWTLDSMAEHCGLGRSRFAHYCKQITNRTPLDHLTRCRVEAARKMLASKKEATITDVALSCGFQSSQYFATVFRRHLGCPPRVARKNGP